LEKGTSYDPSMQTLSTNIASAANNTSTNTTSPLIAKRSIKNNLIEYPGAGFVRFTTSATKTVVACLLRILAITVLAKVHGINLILGLIAAFTAIFATAIVVISPSSSKIEVFAATAGYVLFRSLF
jgi:hypothetical protein